MPTSNAREGALRTARGSVPWNPSDYPTFGILSEVVGLFARAGVAGYTPGAEGHVSTTMNLQLLSERTLDPPVSAGQAPRAPASAGAFVHLRWPMRIARDCLLALLCLAIILGAVYGFAALVGRLVT